MILLCDSKTKQVKILLLYHQYDLPMGASTLSADLPDGYFGASRAIGQSLMLSPELYVSVNERTKQKNEGVDIFDYDCQSLLYQ